MQQAIRIHGFNFPVTRSAVTSSPENFHTLHGRGPSGVQPGDFLLRSGGYVIRPARTAHQHRATGTLVRRMYAWRGYRTEAVGHHLNDAHRVTLAAWHGDDVLATLTLGRDSPAGLLGDALYNREISRLRRQNRVLCEVSRLAVDPDFSSRDLLITLFQAAHHYGHRFLGATDAVIEVNPRHSRYYERQFGFRQIGGERRCPRVDAPAVLLHQEIDDIAIPADHHPWGECSNDPVYFPSADSV